jgi:hypothetical protein
MGSPKLRTPDLPIKGQNAVSRKWLSQAKKDDPTSKAKQGFRITQRIDD